MQEQIAKLEAKIRGKMEQLPPVVDIDNDDIAPRQLRFWEAQS